MKYPLGCPVDRVLVLHKGAATGSVPIVCPTCRDLVSVNGEIEDVSPGEPITAFCSSCERNIEVAAPIGIDAFEKHTDAVAPVRTEFASGAPQA